MPEKMPEIEFTFSPDFKMFYVNHIQASFSPFDITFSMGEAIGAGSSGKFTIQNKARVTMAPLEAKIFLKILAGTIANFEKAIGPIPVPPGVMPEESEVIREG
ncbi:MAG: DUF3467 domain-containing protein [Terriglobales bacterium]